MPVWKTWFTSRKRIFLLITGVIVLLAGGLVWNRMTPGGGENEIRPAPVIGLKDAEGKLVRLQEVPAKVMLVHFWASWCAPCVDEIPTIVKFAKKYEGQPVKLVLISLDETWEDARKILGKEALSSNVISLLDPEIRSGEMFGSYQYPETYLLNGSHEIVTKWIGPQKWGHEFFDQVIGRFLN